MDNNSFEDEVSLIDLVVILIRYRRLILFPILVVSVFLIGGYFFIPEMQLKRDNESNVSEISLSVVPDAALQHFTTNKEIGSMFNDPRIIYEAFISAGFEILPFSSVEEYDLNDKDSRPKILYLIEQRLIKNKGLSGNQLPDERRLFKVLSENNKKNVTISYYSNNIDEIVNFLTSLSQSVNDTLIKVVYPYAEDNVQAFERLLEIDEPRPALQDAIRMEMDLYNVSKEIVGGANTLLKIQEPLIKQKQLTVLTYESSYKKMSIFAIFGLCLFLVFLALILNYIRLIKFDEISMKKIKNVYGKKK